MKTLTALSLVLLFVALTGCGGSIDVSANAPTPCDLGVLKIKDVKIEGDKNNFVSRAVKSALYRRGAKIAPDGVEIIGDVRWGAITPFHLSVEVPTMAFASVANNTEIYTSAPVGAENLAKQVAADFCQCVAAATPPKQAEKPLK